MAGIEAGARHVDRAVAACAIAGSVQRRSQSATKERHDQGEHNAHDDTGDNREVERGTAALDPNIAGQTSKPADAESTPEEKADYRNDATENEQHSAKIAHKER